MIARLSMMLLSLLALAALAAGPGARRVADPGLWISAELPAGWDSEGPGTHAFKPKAGREGIVVSFFDAGDPLRHVQEKAEPTPAQRDARRVTEFRGSTPDHRGPWVLVETHEKSRSGTEHALEAASPAPGGAMYTAAFWAEDEGAFKRDRAVFERFLDTFRRDYPAPRYAPYQGASFSLQAPDAPWKREAEPSAGQTYFFAPGGPDGQPRGVLELQWFSGNPLYASAEAFAKAEGRSTPGHKATALTQRRVAAGSALTWDVDVLQKEDPLAERRTGDRRLLFRWAVLQRKDGFLAVSWMAPPASFEDGLPAFERALATLRFARP